MIVLILAFVLLLSPALGDPKPDLTIPARMTGVASGSLDSSGNIVLNANRVLNILGQFQSITESLYYLETPELNNLAASFRIVMDSLVQTGSPVFQSLSNAARISSGNVSTVFNVIRQNINATIELNDWHKSVINSTVAVLGEPGVEYFSIILDRLAQNVVNISSQLDEIEPAIKNIQRQPQISQSLVDSLYPKDAIKRLNEILQDYVNVGTTAVPQINAVVNRVRLMDSFVVRLQGVGKVQNTYLDSVMNSINNTLSSTVTLRLINAISAISKSVSSSFINVQSKLLSLRPDSAEVIQQMVANVLPIVQRRADNVTRDLEVVGRQVQLKMVERDSRIVLNHTIDTVNELAWRFTLAVTTAQPNASSCYSKLNYEFDKIPRQVYSKLYECAWDEVSTLQRSTAAVAGYLGAAQAELDAEALNYQRCLNGLTINSPYGTKLQQAACLERSKNFSQIYSFIPQLQLAEFGKILRHELNYSGIRYRSCMQVADDMMLVQVNYLKQTIVECLGPQNVTVSA